MISKKKKKIFLYYNLLLLPRIELIKSKEPKMNDFEFLWPVIESIENDKGILNASNKII
jgi:hypothetical protein